MKGVLQWRNLALLKDLGQLHAALSNAQIPQELQAYRACIVAVCEVQRARIEQNLRDLALGRQEILEDILSNTQGVVKLTRLISTRMASPILRALPEDRLSLTLVNWLHREHPVTASIPAGVADGDCAIWPFLHVSPVYFFPCLEQRGLLFQPLFFHEFGHLLYASHKAEMDDLVRDLQKQVAELLVPSSQRNDRYADLQGSRRQLVVDRWYRWTQELACDMIGLTIGGPSFLLAFSRYMGSLERGDFYRQSSDLEQSSHPVPWLRIKLLVERARAKGYGEVADRVCEEWQVVAQTMGIQEDYHGFYDEIIHSALVNTINDMLVEAAPRPCTPSEAEGLEIGEERNLPVSLLNQAWSVYLRDPKCYSVWESSARARFEAAALLSNPPASLQV